MLMKVQLFVARLWIASTAKELLLACAASNALMPQLLTTQGWADKRGLTVPILIVLITGTYLR